MYLEIMFLVILLVTLGYAGKIGLVILKPIFEKARFQFSQLLLSFVISLDSNTGDPPCEQPISYNPLFRSMGISISETTDIRE